MSATAAVTSTRAPSVRRRSSRRRRREAGLAFLLLLPSLVIFGVFIFYPFFKNFYLGFYRTPPFPGLPKRFVGFDQYSEVLTSSEFLNSVKTTVAFAFMTVPTGIVLGLGLAVVAHQKLKGIGVYRTIFSSTVATSVAVAAVIFGTLFNPVVGLLPWLGVNPTPPILDNPVLGAGGGRAHHGLADARTHVHPHVLGPPGHPRRAARSRSGRRRRSLDALLAGDAPAALSHDLLRGDRRRIFAFQTFGQIDLLTQGGPLKRTNVLTYFIYNTLRTENNDGKAAVLAIALFAITLVLTAVQMRVLERRVHYGR